METYVIVWKDRPQEEFYGDLHVKEGWFQLYNRSEERWIPFAAVHEIKRKR